MATIIKDLGPVSAYAYAVTQGYTGTEEEFAELMASYADVGQTAVSAAQTATAKASEAATSATTATNKATEASTSATSASGSATAASASASQASGSATSAANSATAASGSATAAAGSATTASTKASEASASATDAATAKTGAEAAQTAAETAQGKAEDAQAAAETTAQSISASAAQIATNAADIAELKSEVSQKANINGYYEELSAGTADQLNSTQYVEDSVPYLFRTTGGSADVGDRADVRAIVGGTVVWNQYSLNTRGTNTVNGITFTNNGDGSITVNGTATATTTFNSVEQSGDTAQLNHVYLIRGCPSGGAGDTYFLQQPMVTGSLNKDIGAGKVLRHTTSATRLLTQIYIANGTTVTNAIFKPQLFDLTQMFGTTIADYIYSLEQANAGAGVAFFRKLFPADYYPYDVGTLKSVEGVSEKVTRDADNNVLGTYPLDSTLTLRGIPKLADGKLSYDGDRYLPDGTVERRYGIVDLGTLNWQLLSGATDFYYAPVVLQSNVQGEVKLICSNYETYPTAQPRASEAKYAMSDKQICRSYATSQPFVYIYDSAYTDATTFKAAMSGVMLVYELATPTTEDATPYRQLQVCDPDGTEEFVSTGIVPVGHETRYPENLRAKIEGLPWDFSSLIAPTEKTTTASRNYTTGSLLIMNNVLYKATANIANGGTITPGTNVTATTLSEVISALQ